jgi:hypothetical protein
MSSQASHFRVLHLHLLGMYLYRYILVAWRLTQANLYIPTIHPGHGARHGISPIQS